MFVSRSADSIIKNKLRESLHRMHRASRTAQLGPIMRTVCFVNYWPLEAVAFRSDAQSKHSGWRQWSRCCDVFRPDVCKNSCGGISRANRIDTIKMSAPFENRCAPHIVSFVFAPLGTCLCATGDESSEARKNSSSSAEHLDDNDSIKLVNFAHKYVPGVAYDNLT